MYSVQSPRIWMHTDVTFHLTVTIDSSGTMVITSTHPGLAYDSCTEPSTVCISQVKPHAIRSSAMQWSWPRSAWPTQFEVTGLGHVTWTIRLISEWSTTSDKVMTISVIGPSARGCLPASMPLHQFVLKTLNHGQFVYH